MKNKRSRRQAVSQLSAEKNQIPFMLEITGTKCKKKLGGGGGRNFKNGKILIKKKKI